MNHRLAGLSLVWGKGLRVLGGRCVAEGVQKNLDVRQHFCLLPDLALFQPQMAPQRGETADLV